MKIYGSFTSNDHIHYYVEIYDDTPNEGEQIQIGTDGVFFDDDPVSLIRELDDSFTPIITHTAEINMHTNRYLGDKIFSASLDRYVKICENNSGGTVVFLGYVQPITFEQEYVKHLDSFTVNCIDVLGGLQYSKWKSLTKDTYKAYNESHGNVSFYGILSEVLATPQYGMEFPMENVYYDASVGVNSADTHNVFSHLLVDEYVMLGDDYDSLVPNNETLENMLTYLNLHAIQIGDIIYLFNWESIRKRRDTWYSIGNETYSAVTLPSVATITTFTGDMHADADNNITIDDVFAQVSVKDNIEDADDVIASPLDDDSLGMYYTKQLFLTEYKSGGEGSSAYNAFRALILGNDTDYENCQVTDHYVQHCYNPQWKMYVKFNGEEKPLDDYVTVTNLGQYVDQNKLLDIVYSTGNTPNCGMFQFGHTDRPSGVVKDNSPQAKLDMTPYIVITCNGNENDTQAGTFPKESNIKSHSHFIEYTSPQHGVTYSPVDNSYTNYLVFSGKFILQRVQQDRFMSDFGYGYNGVKQHIDDWQGIIPTFWHRCSWPSYDGNGDGMYYTRQWYKTYYPTSTPVTQPDSYRSLMPPVERKDSGLYTYEYSREGYSGDLCYKVPIIECELIIGNKRLIETSMGKVGQSKLPTYQWVTVGQEPYITYTDYDGTQRTTQVKTFTLGFNPKIGDPIVGEEYDIQNTVDWSKMNLDTEGTAIPMTYTDNLVGDLTFKIIGPVYSTWNYVSKYYHGWWLWRHSLWDEESIPILAHVENIFIKDFKCEMKTDMPQQKNAEEGGSDIIYVSAEENYPTVRDDCEFNIVTQPSLQTCLEIGSEYKSAKNAAMVLNNGEGVALTAMFDATLGEHDVPEKLYVNQYYREYHTPKILLKGTYHLKEADAWRKIYRSTPLGGKDFYMRDITQSLRYNTAEITFKEV